MANPVTPATPSRPLPPRPTQQFKEQLRPVTPTEPLTHPALKKVASATTTRLEPVMEGDAKFLPHMEKPPPGEQLRMKISSPALSRHRSRYFERALGSPRELEEETQNVRAQAIVLAEIKTNVIINDEAAFMSNLASLIARRYDRPITSVAVTVEHGVCMLFSGTFDPAYIITIHAIPSLVQPVTNKRNLALLQHHLECALRVPSSRGLVRFVSVPEDCFGRNGRTVAGDIMEAVGAATLNSLEERTVAPTRTSKKEGFEYTPKSSIPSETKAGARLERMSREETNGDPRGHELEPPPRRSSSEAVASPARLRGLKNKRSLQFISSLFNKPSKTSQEATQHQLEDRSKSGDQT
ncbi:hypothetical protein V2G26_020755 [Clonostachys chloroleuca]